MRPLPSLCLVGLLLSVGLPVSTAPSAPSAAQAVESGTAALARAQDVLVSRKVAGLNSHPDFEVSPKGDVLVAWARDVLSDRASGTEVWVALVKRKTSGKFKKKPKPVRLSTGTDFNFGARIAWIEELQQFFVVWERAGGSDNSKTILGRAVNGKTGKPVGSVKTLISDDRYNTTPVITASFVDGKQNITLVYVSAPNPFARHAARGASKTEIKMAKLRDGRVAVDAVELMAMKEGDDIRILGMADPAPLTLRTCRVVLYRTFDEFSRGFAHVKLVVNGKVTDERKIRLSLSASGTGSIGARAGMVLVQVEGLEDGALIRFRTSCLPGSTLQLAETSRIAFDFVEEMYMLINQRQDGGPARDPIRIGELGYLLSSQTDGKAYQQLMNEDLNLVGTQELLFDHHGTMTSMSGGDITPDSSNRSARLGKKPNSVLVWTKSVGDAFDEEIRAHFFYLKPVE